MSVSNENLCPICYDAFQEGQATLSHRPEGSRVTAAAAEALEASAASRPDEHKFHQDCLVTWLRSSFHCPVCRAAGDVFGLQSVQPENVGLAVQEAARNGHLETVQALLANGPISANYRGWAFESAAARGHLDIVRALLAIGPISDVFRGWAVENAAERGHLDIVQALLANGPISEDDRGEAVARAASHGHLDIVQALLAHGPISENLRGWAVARAASHGHLDIVQALLASGTIIDRYQAIKNALKAGHFKIASELAYVKPMIAGALAAAATAYISSLSQQEDT